MYFTNVPAGSGQSLYFKHWLLVARIVCVEFAKISQSNQGPVVQSIVSLMSLLRVILLTVLVDSIYSILIFFAEKM